MQWHYSIKLSGQYQSQSLRDLLQKTWLLPRKIVHFLRINQQVHINKSYHPVNTFVKKGDQLDLCFDSSDFETPLPPFDPDFSQIPDVLFENKDLIVVNKPSGIKTHSNQPHELGSMMNYLQGYFDQTPNNAYNIHRLDQWTSGALLVAKNPVVIPILSRQISEKIITRTYFCVVSGHLKQTTGTIDLPIGIDPLDQRKRQINGPSALNAITHYQVVDTTTTESILKVTLATGRTHQIRVHLANLGHPIVGDPLYNPIISSNPMLLHSWKITFPLPFSLETKTVTAPIPAYFNLSQKN